MIYRKSENHPEAELLGLWEAAAGWNLLYFRHNQTTSPPYFHPYL